MEGKNELSHNAIGMWGVIFYSISLVSPAFMFTIGSATAIAYAGKAAPLAFLIAGISNFSAVIPLYIYSRYVSNSGGYFKFIEAATQNLYISKNVGLWSLSVSIGAMIVGGTIVAWYVSSTLNTVFNITISTGGAILLSLMVPLLYLVIGYFRIRFIARTAITIGLLQLAVFTALSIAFILRTPYNSGAYFNVASSTGGLHGFFFAMILGAFFSYGGYGAVVALGEEVKFSKKTMKRAIVYSLSILVVFETLAIYSMAAAAGPDIGFLGSLVSPSVYLGMSYFGTYIAVGTFVVGLFGIIFSSVLTGNNGARYVFALARDSLLPACLTRIHKQFKSPYMAVVFIFLISVAGLAATETVMVSLFGLVNGLFYSWTVWGTFTVTFSMLMSIITNSTLVLFIRRIKKKVSLLIHIIAPSISTAIMILALWFSLANLRGVVSSAFAILLFTVIIHLVIVYRRRHQALVSLISELISE